MKECADELTLQAWFDGELDETAARRVAAHLPACAKCAAAAQEIEDETALLAMALEPELAAPVPTANLWARLESAVAEMAAPAAIATPRPSFAARWREGLGALQLRPQQAFALVGLAALCGGLAWLASGVHESGAKAERLAQISWPAAEIKPAVTPATTPAPVASPPQTPQSNIVAVKYAKPAAALPKASARREPQAPALLPGESGYLKTIASLERAVAAQQEDLNAQPQIRAVYERNIALLNQAIKATQAKARRNPKDEDAAEMLYASYQSKVDLMNTVAVNTRFAIAER
jgi:hypothetical protein